ncbi:MAG: hypothetical protein JWQ35_534 [Bacteriovoracaceae bacterium]|nr:hypothetical protein [Bacteriovoracaceae bacterium]
MILSVLLGSQLLVSALENPKNNFPNLVGGSGNLRTFSAQPNEPTTFGANLIGSFFSKDPFLNGIKDSRNQFRVDGNYTFDVGVPLEVFGGFTLTYNDNSDSKSATTMTTFFENADLGLRYGRRAFSDHFFLGAYAYSRAFSGTRAFRNTSGGSTVKSGPMMSGALGFTQTYDRAKDLHDFPFREHLNIGYRLPNGTLIGSNDDFNRFALDSFHFQAIVAAVSGELVYKFASPFIEYSMEYAISASAPKPKFSDNRQKVTLGVRITPISSFSVLVASDIGVGGPASDIATGIPKNPPYDIFFGLAFQTLASKLKNDVGSVRGVVTDQATGSPLDGVKISVVGDSSLSFTTDASGTYEFDLLKNGNYQARFEKPGFESTAKSFSIREGGDTILDASIGNRMPKTGNLDLTVLDAETHGPLKRAFVKISGLDSGLATDDYGKLQVKSLLEGEHTVTADAPGYIAGNTIIQISPTQVLQQSLQLTKAPPETGICAGVVKNPEGTPLTAVFTSANGKVQPFGTDPVTGVFSQSLQAGSYELKVQAENYLPQTVICNVAGGETTKLEIALEKPKAAVVIDNKIVLPDAIYFEFGKADIKRESFGILDQVVDILLKNDNYKELKIEGHTDNVGGEAPNQKLSEKRAAAVRLYLIKKGVKGAKVTSSGFGKTKPVATNLTPEGRAENRRVEFNLVRNE